MTNVFKIEDHLSKIENEKFNNFSENICNQITEFVFGNLTNKKYVEDIAIDISAVVYMVQMMTLYKIYSRPDIDETLKESITESFIEHLILSAKNHNIKCKYSSSN